MVSRNSSHLIIISCLLSVIWVQVFLSNTNNFQTALIDPLDGTLNKYYISGQSRPGRGDKEIFYTSQSLKARALSLDEVSCQALDNPFFGRFYLSLEDTDVVF